MPTASVYPDRITFYWLAATSALVLAPLVPRVPPVLWLLILGLFAWRYAMLARAWRAPGRALRIGLTALVLVLVYLHYRTLIGRDAGITLLACLLALKFIELKNPRDATVCVFLLYFLMLGSFLYSQSIALAAYLLTAAVVASASLVRITLPDSTLSGRQLLRLAGTLLLKAVPIMLIMYLLFPRIQGTLWGLPHDAYSGLTGISDEMRPGSINQLSLSDEVAFRVNFQGPPPAIKDLYWRVLVLWDSDGQGWSRGVPGQWPAYSFQTKDRPVTYEISFEPSNKPWLPALDLPGAAPDELRLRAGYVMDRSQPVRERLRYELTSYLRYNTGDLEPAERQRSLRLPTGVSARVRELAQGWRAPARDTVEVVNAALGYFRAQEFYYTLEPPLLGDDPVDEFLFDTQRGFCEHYAAAFVTLMRAAGIPSRVVIGYQGGEFNAAGNYLIVRQGDAHAWAEAWLAGRGWVRVDPTGAVAPERIEYGAEALRRLAGRGQRFGQLPPEALRLALGRGWLEGAYRRGRLAFDTVNNTWNRLVLDYTKERQEKLLREMGFEEVTRTALVGALSVLVAAVVVLLALFMWRAERAADPVRAAYERFCRKLARIGLSRAAHEGPLDFAQRCGRERPDLKPAIDAVTRAYIGLRYADLRGREHLRTLRRLVAHFSSKRGLA
jgi:transglutaminase-like putative cysteine protease